MGSKSSSNNSSSTTTNASQTTSNETINDNSITDNSNRSVADYSNRAIDNSITSTVIDAGTENNDNRVDYSSIADNSTNVYDYSQYVSDTSARNSGNTNGSYNTTVTEVLSDDVALASIEAARMTNQSLLQYLGGASAQIDKITQARALDSEKTISFADAVIKKQAADYGYALESVLKGSEKTTETFAALQSNVVAAGMKTAEAEAEQADKLQKTIIMGAAIAGLAILAIAA